NIDARLYNKTGGFVWVNLRGRISKFDTSGIPVRVSGVLVDISDRKRLEDQLVELATTDDLTGLYNRGHGSELLDRELTRAKRSDQPLSLILMDVDHFKSINDEFGHAVGDQVLVKISESLQNRIREVDIAARWGGEEFVIILPDTRLDDAKTIAGELQKGIRSLAKPDGNHLSMSMGVTQYRTDESVSGLLKRADQLLYTAKNTGRNRMETQP
ncbi:MAG: GGDEF domain-containing protein, partial [Pseudomonadota bacterium]